MHPSQDIIELLKRIEGVAWRCILMEHYFDMVTNLKNQFWILIQNILGESVILHWSYLFGKSKDDLNYERFFDKDDVVKAGESFLSSNVKKRLLERIKMNDEEYDKLWNNVMRMRDKFIAHHDIALKKITFPEIDKCREMAEELRVILGLLIEEWLRVVPYHEELKGLRFYYSQNTNVYIAPKCKSDFENGIITIAKIILQKKFSIED